jgi:hypothetical protein
LAAAREVGADISEVRRRLGIEAFAQATFAQATFAQARLTIGPESRAP